MGLLKRAEVENDGRREEWDGFQEEGGGYPGTRGAWRRAARGNGRGVPAGAGSGGCGESDARRFTAAHKLLIAEKADACETPGEIGELLRREGLYSSHLSTWRKAAREGSLRELAKKRGPKPAGGKREARKVRKLERENARLREELRKARIIIDVQGKVAGLLGVSPGDGKRS